MAKISPTQLTLAECRKREWQCQTVERWIQQARKRIDLFGVGDIIALDGLPGSLLIQATSGSNHSARVKKACAEPRLVEWLLAENRFAVWSWSKRMVGKRQRWTLREQCIDLETWHAS